MTDISDPKTDCVYYYEQKDDGGILPRCLHYDKRRYLPCPKDCDRYLHNDYKKGHADGIRHVYEATHVDVLEKIHIHIVFDNYCKNCNQAEPILNEDHDVEITFDGPVTVVTDRYLTCEKIKECRETVRCYKQYLEEKEKENE